MNFQTFIKLDSRCVRSILFLFLTVIPFNIFSQIHQEWVQRYNGVINAPDNSLVAITTDATGSIIITGIVSTSNSGYDFATIKYNSSGTQLWIRYYNGTGNGNDLPSAITSDNSGNSFVTGQSKDAAGNLNYVTIKYNSSGVQQWVSIFQGPSGYSIPTALCLDPGGNVYVTGYDLSIPGSQHTGLDYLTVKYNSGGVQQWVQRGNPGIVNDDRGYAIAADVSGNVYVTGASSQTGGYSIATIKYNSSGVQQWIKLYDGPAHSYDEGYSIAVNSGGDVYVTGYVTGVGTSYDYATLKYNSSGVQQWANIYNGPGNGNDIPQSVRLDVSGNVYVTGTSRGSGTDYDFCTIKYNPSGVQQWVARYNSPDNDYESPSAMTVDTGGIFITGTSYRNGPAKNFATVKYSFNGALLWNIEYNGTGNGDDAASSIAVNGNDIYVGGTSLGNGTGTSFALVKYSPLIGIKRISSVIPVENMIMQNYPNPFNPNTNIRFDVSKYGFVTLKIYSILGEELKTIVSESLAPGKYNVEFDCSDLASGTYFYRINTDYYSQTMKMEVLK